MNYRHNRSYLKESISFGLPRFCVFDKSKAFNWSIPVLHVKNKISVLFLRLGQYWSNPSLLWIRKLTPGQRSIKKDFREGRNINEINSKLEVVWTTVIQFFSHWYSMSMFLHLNSLKLFNQLVSRFSLSVLFCVIFYVLYFFPFLKNSQHSVLENLYSIFYILKKPIVHKSPASI